MKLIESLKWRYATKKFDASKKISEQDFKKLQEAIQLTATSYGLQLFKVINVVNKETREQLKPVSWGQTQITDASHLLVLCSYTKVTDQDIDEAITLRSEIQNIPLENLKAYGEFMKMKLGEFSETEQQVWAARQTYIVLGNLLSACAELKIDACPMEGFEPEKYTDILNLKEKDLQPTLAITIGYRAEDDETQHLPKSRKSINDLFYEV